MWFHRDWQRCSALTLRSLTAAEYYLQPGRRIVIKAGGIGSAPAYQAWAEGQRKRSESEGSKHSVWLRHSDTAASRYICKVCSHQTRPCRSPIISPGPPHLSRQGSTPSCQPLSAPDPPQPRPSAERAGADVRARLRQQIIALGEHKVGKGWRSRLRRTDTGRLSDPTSLWVEAGGGLNTANLPVSWHQRVHPLILWPAGEMKEWDKWGALKSEGQLRFSTWPKVLHPAWELVPGPFLHSNTFAENLYPMSDMGLDHNNGYCWSQNCIEWQFNAILSDFCPLKVAGLIPIGHKQKHIVFNQSIDFYL